MKVKTSSLQEAQGYWLESQRLYHWAR